MRDQRFLKTQLLVERMEAASGKTLDQLQDETIAAAQITAIRLKALDLEYPKCTAIGIYEYRDDTVSRMYRVRRSVGRKGFRSDKSTIAYNVIDSLRIYNYLLWFHVSLSRQDGKMPTYDDLCWLKEHWFGGDRWAIQVFPEKDQHVNDHPKCLHLWGCLEAEFSLPDFRMFGSI